MSFINHEKGRGYAPGYFLADNMNVERKTQQLDATGAAETADGGKYIPAGTVWPSNDANALGIVYEDVDVTSGSMPGSVVLRGTVYENRLPVALTEEAKAALEAHGFSFCVHPTITRP